MNPGASLTMFARLGFAARGLLYIIIAVLLIRAGQTEDLSGALTYLSRGGGRILVVAMAVGFAAYGLWRLADATMNVERHDMGKKGTGERLGALGSGVVHLALAWQAYQLSTKQGDVSGGSESGAEQGARTALALPGGEFMLMVAGIILVAVGIFQFLKAAKCSFRDNLDPAVAKQPFVKWAGRAGYTARGLIFSVTGFFLLKAGSEGRASEAGGMEEALRWLNSPWDVMVALGLLLFGLFSLIEARFRVIHEVPLDAAVNAARARLP